MIQPNQSIYLLLLPNTYNADIQDAQNVQVKNLIFIFTKNGLLFVFRIVFYQIKFY